MSSYPADALGSTASQTSALLSAKRRVLEAQLLVLFFSIILNLPLSLSLFISSSLINSQLLKRWLVGLSAVCLTPTKVLSRKLLFSFYSCFILEFEGALMCGTGQPAGPSPVPASSPSLSWAAILGAYWMEM